MGLLREEVAILADVSPNWYELLEQGRRVTPSAEMLDALGDALRLDDANRRYLHALGGRQSDSALPDPAVDADVVDTARKLIAASHCDRYPLLALDSAGNLLAWNHQATIWYDDFAAYDEQDRNLDWWFFTAPVARERIVDWEQEARSAVARMRYTAAFSRAAAPVHAVHRALRAASADFARWWDEHDVADHHRTRRRFRHPSLGITSMDLLTTQADLNPSTTIVFHVPAMDPDPPLQ